MKKILMLLFAMTLLFAFVSCKANEKVKYSVAFDTCGGSEVATQQVEENQTITPPSAPTKDGYTFAGWTYQGEAWPFADAVVTGDITLTAMWEKATYTITYVTGDGATVPDNPATFTIDSGDIALIAPTREHYTFIGWTEAELATPQISMTLPAGSFGDRTFTAHWEPIAEDALIVSADGVLTGLTAFGQSLAALEIPAELNGVAITAIGQEAFCPAGGILESVILPDSVIAIGNGAFMGCAHLTSAAIGNGVLVVGSYAFYGCSALTDIVLPDQTMAVGAMAFADCEKLKQVTIGSGAMLFGESAFKSCTSVRSVYYTGDIGGWCGISFLNYEANPVSYAQKLYVNDALLTEAIIPEGVSAIGTYAFSRCSDLTHISLPNSLTTIGDCAFNACSATITWGSQPAITEIGPYAFQNYWGKSLTVPQSVTTIGEYAFVRCRNLTDITLPAGLTSIGQSAFEGCALLSQIALPGGVTAIGAETFKDCAALFGVTLGSGLTSIGDYAFSGCTSLIDLALPAGLTTIGEGAFENCVALARIALPDSVTSLGAYALRGCTGLTSVVISGGIGTIPADLFRGCRQLATARIGYGVTAIGEAAFCSCTGLLDVTIPGSVTNIGNDAFRSCISLTSVVIPDGVTFIGNGAFAQCVSLASITIPDSVTFIGYGVFAGCTELTSLVIPAGVTFIGEGVFRGCTNLTDITVPFIGKQDNGDSDTNLGYFFGNGTDDIYNQNHIYVPVSLKQVTITNCTVIDDYALQRCKDVTHVTIGGSVTHIGRAVFSNCTSLKSITYEGTVAAWNAIEKDSFWDINLSGYTVHCTDGDVTA